MIWYASSKNFSPRVRSIAFPRRELSLRIAFVADVHANRYLGPAARDRVVEKVISARPDLLLLGGDYGESRADTRDFWSRLRRAVPALGAFAVPGNNDLEQYETDYPLLRRDAEEAGIRMLINEEAVLDAGGARVRIGGTDDAFVGNSDTTGFFADPQPNDFRILLTHRPKKSVLLGLSDPCDLMLCGHTHGGQGNFLGITPYTLRYEYRDDLIAVAGEKQVGDTRVLISNGIGMSKIPLRIGVPPEILMIECG